MIVQNSTKEILPHNAFVEYKNIRIRPPFIVFSDCFEGKKYEQEIILQNVGGSPVFIRILPPSASSIKMKALEHGKFLCPGLLIKRTITYTVVTATLVESCIIPIYIDDEVHNYSLKVESPNTSLIVEPQFLDFGVINAGPVTTRKKFSLQNPNLKPVRFAIDLGSNELNLVVEPMKGIVMEKMSVEISVSLSLLEEGSFVTEFWIICDNPVSLKLRVTVVLAKIEAIHKFALNDFTLIQFPRTYYGTKNMKTLLLRNQSETSSVFCITGQVNGKMIPPFELKHSTEDYKQFGVSPLNGRLCANDVRPFLFTFEPIVNRKSRKEYFVAMLQINKIFCNDLDASLYEDGLFIESEGEYQIKPRKSVSSSLLLCETIDDVESSTEQPNDLLISEACFTGNICVILYGEPEEPSVSVKPDEFVLEDLEVEKPVARVLRLTNNSHNLPISVQFKKVLSIELNPKIENLSPGQSKEVIVTVTPRSYMPLDTHIHLDLIYDDASRSLGNKLCVVGVINIPVSLRQKIISKQPSERACMTCVPVRSFNFRKPNQKPKQKILQSLQTEDALIALPDDRPHSLRPWRGTKVCKTIYAAMPRKMNIADEFELSASVAELKRNNKILYNSYIASHKTLRSVPSLFRSYSVDEFKHKCFSCTPKKKQEHGDASFISLSPLQLFNINITPRSTYIEGVISRTDVTNTITVRNANDVSIRIYLKPHNHKIFQFPYGSRMVIGPKQERQITYLYFTGLIGIRTDMLDLIVNECHVFNTSITVKVSAILLKFSADYITFKAQDPPYVNLLVSNATNSTIDFFWSFVGDLNVEPLEGAVLPGQTLTCLISYDLTKCESSSYDLIVTMGRSTTKTFNVKIEKMTPLIDLASEVSFDYVPINIESTVSTALKNNSMEDVIFSIDASELIDGLSIRPTSGGIQRRGKQLITFVINRFTCGEFTCEVTVKINNYYKIKVKIFGNVVFPELHYNTKLIRFKKIAASSFDSKTFVVKNVGKVRASINFDVNAIPDLRYAVSDRLGFLKDTDDFYINPGESIEFALHIYPSYPAITSYHLPIIVNKIPSFGEKTKLYIKVHISVQDWKLQVNSWTFDFIYFPHYNVKSNLHHVVRIKNSSKVDLVFCIRLDYLKKPFTFNHVKGGIICSYPLSITCSLEDDEEVFFEVYFKPQTPGIYEMCLPVYIQNDDEEIHNCLRFKGLYYEPKLLLNCKRVYFGNVPRNFTVKKLITLKLENHNPNCEINIITDEVEVHMNKKDFVMEQFCQIPLKLMYCPKEDTILSRLVKFSCTCGAYAQVLCVGGSENCLLTVHQCVKYFELMLNSSPDEIFSARTVKCGSKGSSTSLVDKEVRGRRIGEFDPNFPFFPTTMDAYSAYMESVVATLEQWMFEEIFQYEIYYKIPDTISIFYMHVRSDTENVTVFSRSNFCNLPLYNLLSKLCGNTIKDLFSLKYKEEKKVSVWVQCLYLSILSFLESMGAIMPHVFAEYLLNYENYVDFMKTTTRAKDTLSYNDFYLISKQCWVDLILQTYKSLSYKKLITNPVSQCNLGSKKSIANMSSMSTKLNSDLGLNQTLYDTESTMLLGWLNLALDNQREFIASEAINSMSKYDNIRSKRIRSFGTDLVDGLALLAVTLNYCPYLVKYFHGFYVPPRQYEEYIHNASLLIKVWNMLNICFTLKPVHINVPNAIHMIIIVSYLFDFLKNMVPSETLYFTAKLGSTTSQSVTVYNDNKVAIKFKILTFNNENEAFTCAESKISVWSKNKSKITITYIANFMKRESIVLVLSGEVIGGAFSNSKAYNLEGYPTLASPNTDLVFTTKAFVLKQIQITVQSPYQQVAEYEVYIIKDKPSDVDSVEIFPYKQYLESRTISRFRLDNYLLTSDENGCIAISGDILSVMSNTLTVWVLFKSKIGDFFVSVTSRVEPIKKVHNLSHSLPKNFTHYHCSCRNKLPDTKNLSCPRTIVIKIESRNPDLWKTMITRYISFADKGEKIFWEQYKSSTLAVVILKNLYDMRKKFVSYDIAPIFDDIINYKIISKTNNVAVQPAVDIHFSISSTDTTDIAVHLNDNHHKSFMFTMFSGDNQEVRNYMVHTTYET